VVKQISSVAHVLIKAVITIFFALPKLVIKNLIRAFDYNTIAYMFFWFPMYQIIAFIGLIVVFNTYGALGELAYATPVAIGLTVFVGLPILASWHLSVLLFGVGYFGFFARIGIPFMGWATDQIKSAVNWFR